MIEWSTNDNDQTIPQPKHGMDSQFDTAKARSNEIKEKLYDYLITVQRRFDNTSIRYCHPKYRFELEIPESLVKGDKKPLEYEFTSSRIGYQRFHTQEIKKLVDQLEDAEEIVNQTLVPFIASIFSHFYSKKEIWDRLVS